MAVSAVYATGVRATAITNITNKVATYFTAATTGAGVDGVKRLNAPALVAWLQTEFNKISGDTGGASVVVYPTDVAIAAQSFNSSSAGSLVDSLNARIRPETLATRSDYPDTSPGTLGPRVVASIVGAKAELKRISDDIAAYYNEAYRTDDNSMLVQSLLTHFQQEQIDLRIRPAVERLVETRAYIVTHVTALGEESAPSPVSALIEVDQADTVTVTQAYPATINWGTAGAGRNITYIRLYRSLSGSSAADFQYVPNSADVNGWPVVATTNKVITDNIAPEKLGEVCPSKSWAEPPYRTQYTDTAIPPTPYGTNPYLRGLVGMPNGVMAGFFDATVCFCEPFLPYAWPVEYQISLRHSVVGLGVFGQTLFVGTSANPYYISGSDSASMSAVMLDSKQSCASARSIVEVPGGVLYASPDGLCLASNAGIKVVTTGIFTREIWQAMTPSSIFAAEHDGIYYFWYTGSGGGCYALDLESGKLVKVAFTASAAFTDKYTDTMYIASGTTLTAVLSASRMTGTWRSKRFILDQQASYAWITVMSDFSASVVVRLYTEDIAVGASPSTRVLRHTATLTNSTPQRLPAGRYKEWEIEVETTAKVTEVTIASSTQELQAV